MKEWIRDIIAAVVIAAVVLTFIKPTIVKERSMEPTLYNNDYLFISKQSYKLFGEPKRGDIIVFHTELETNDGHEKMLIKRIIGLPGDTVEFMNGQVYVNGELLTEDYIKEPYTDPHDAGTYFEVPEGCVFAMGDNRGVSMDSRYRDVGYVAIDDILGKAVIRLFPFNQIKLLK